MKKPLLLFLFIIFCSVSVYPQNLNIIDTINVVTLEKFKVPDDRNIVFTNIMDISFDSQLLDEGRSVIRKIEDDNKIVQGLDSGDRGGTVQYSLTESIEEAGNYYVQINVRYRDEVGSKTITAYYYIIVDNPTMAGKLNLYEKYYPTETESFSFATSEYTDQTAYSYEISDGGGNAILTGKGSVVNLNDLLKNDDYIGRSFTITGRYRDQVFKYKPIDNPENVKESVWNFSLAQPILDEYVNWWSSDMQGEKPDNVYISPLNPFLLRFLYVYTGLSGAGNLVVIPPNITALRITSEPADFLASGGGTARVQNNFGYVFLNLNQSYIDAMEIGDEVQVNIQVQFNTQYERNVQRTYTATIIK